MKIGMVGLGRMGANMARRLMRGGHECVVFDLDPGSVGELAGEGAEGAASIGDLVGKLASPRAVWVMVPAGEPTEETVERLAESMSAGDIVIDGGNTYYKDDLGRSRRLAARKIRYVDVGTSGGIRGIDRGYCLMIGGPGDAVKHLDPIFRTLAPGRGSIERTPGRSARTTTAEDGYLHCGGAGAGHFVKMIHNGIEYGLMQAYAEGLDILASSGKNEIPEGLRYDLDVSEIAEVWRRGSVIGSWLLDLTAAALLEDPKLESYSGFVQDSGEGRWSLIAAIESEVPAEVLAGSLFSRFRSRQEHTFTEKVLSAMRKKFGGHVERPTGG